MGAIAVAVPCMMGILFYFVIFYLAALARWMVLKRIAKDVNQYLPDSEQYPTSLLAFLAQVTSVADQRDQNLAAPSTAVFPRELPSMVTLSYLIVFFLRTLPPV